MARMIKVKRAVYPGAAQISMAEHLDVLTACVNRDAAAAMALHLAKAMGRNLWLLWGKMQQNACATRIGVPHRACHAQSAPHSDCMP